MKRIIVVLVFVCNCFLMVVNGQNNLKEMDDYERISFGVFIDQDRMEGMESEIVTMLGNKLRNNISSKGMASSNNSRFFLTCNQHIISKEVVQSSSAMIAVKIELSIYSADNIEKKIFGNTSFNFTGVGKTEKSAYRNAIKELSNRETKISELLDKSKNKIIQYYNSNCNLIMSKVEALASVSKFDEALYELDVIPSVCKECYEKANSKKKVIFKNKVDYECELILAKSKAIWSAKQDESSARKALDLLVSVHPISKCYNDAMNLSNSIHDKIELKQEQERQFRLEQYRDDVELKKLETEALRDVLIEYGRNQPEQVYTTYYVW